MIRDEEEEEEDYGTLEESLISFQLSGANKELSWSDQLNDEWASSEDSVVHTPCKEQRRQYTRKEKGKMKMPEQGTDKGVSNQGEFDTIREEEPQEVRSDATTMALKSANEKLHQSIHHKNPMNGYGYNEYMGNHYAYMMKVP